MQLAGFIEFLQNRSGDSLRAVQWYRGEETELIYLRDDLDVDEVKPRTDELHLQLIGDGDSPETPHLRELGDCRATVNIYDEVVLVNFPVDENYGVVVGLEPIVASSLHEFVAGCRASLADRDDAEP